MIKTYIKIAWRNLTRNKVSSTINIAGLAIGLACAVLIALYIKHEMGYDTFFADAQRIYRVNIDGKMRDDNFRAGHTPPPAGEALLRNFPEVESYTRIYRPGDEIIHFERNGEKLFLTERNLLSVDSNFLQFFSYPLVKGNAANCLNGPNFAVLTQKAAKKYFGNANPIGKTLVFDEYSQPFTVTAVLKDLPAQSSLQFDVLQSNMGMPPVKRFSWSWVWLQMGTYVKLKPNVSTADIARMDAAFPAMVSREAVGAFERIGLPYNEFKKSGGHWDLHLQPITDVHLHSADVQTRFFEQGDIKNVYIFIAVGVFIILLACVNFMNLSTAQSARRAKEVGIRKLLGSVKKQLVAQFITEAVLFALLAGIIAIALVALCLPAFSSLADRTLSFSEVIAPTNVSVLLALIGITGLLAGSYPAFVITAFKPVSVLKGSVLKGNNGSAFSVRNALVVFQFTVAIALIICTIVVYKQLRYSQSKDLGMDKENVLVINHTDRLKGSEQSFKRELQALTGVSTAAITNGLPAKNSFTDFYMPEAGEGDKGAQESKLSISSYLVDANFVPAMGLKILKGRAFSTAFADSASVILNETAVRQIGWKNAIGKRISYPGGGDQTFTVIGVMKDFNSESLHSAITPFALFYITSKTYTISSSYVVARIKPGNYERTIKTLEAKWKQFLPDTPFEYSFLDQEFDALYRADQIISRVFSVFAALSLVVACMGLFGLAIYTAEMRTKEIGIRKVLGASVQSVVAMLSTDYLKLILVAALIAFPIGWYIMNNWLNDFAYRTAITWWVFAVAGGATIVVALVTVIYQSLRAAVANPVKSLRSE